jgi:general secretion pathway protein M
MMAALRSAWQSRSPLERKVMASILAAVVVVLYAWLLQSAGRNRERLGASLPTLRAQATRLDAQALEYARLRATPAATASTTDLRTLLQARIGEAGLAPALVTIEAAEPGQVRATFGALPFAEWLAWVAALQALQVRVDQCRIEALPATGMVSVIATFTRAQP